MPPTDPVLPLRGTELLWGEQDQRACELGVHRGAHYLQLLGSGWLSLTHPIDPAVPWGLNLKMAWSPWLSCSLLWVFSQGWACVCVKPQAGLGEGSPLHWVCPLVSHQPFLGWMLRDR